MDGATIKTGAHIGAKHGQAGVAFVYAAFALLALLLTWPTLPDMARTWLGSSTYHHGIFVAPAALWMILAHSRTPVGDSSPTIGLFVIVAGTLLWLLGRAGGAAIIEQAALISILVGGVGAVYGHSALRAWAWPLAFLYFMVPAGDSLLPTLQFATAKMVVGALSLFGFEIVVDGIVIQTRVGAFAIAEACAGLNVLIAAVMVSVVFAYVSFEYWWKRVAFILFAAIFAIIANAVRAFFLILIPLLTGEQGDIGPDHYIVGWILYLFVLIALAMIGRRFADRRIETASAATAPGLRIVPPAIAVGYLIAGAVYANNVIDRSIDRTAPATLSLLNAPGWRILPPPQNWRADIPQADRSVAATYASADTQVYVALSYVTHDRRGAEIAGRSVSAGKDWDRIGGHDAVIYLFGSSEQRRLNRLSGPQGRKYLALRTYWLGNDIYFTPGDVKIAQAKLKMRGENPGGGVMIFTAPYVDDPDEAVRAIGRFTTDLEKFSDWRARLAQK